jgi:Holliday junction resolvase RusA-like endonuclease
VGFTEAEARVLQDNCLRNRKRKPQITPKLPKKEGEPLITLHLPTSIPDKKGKNWRLNLNVYRNTHHYILNYVKKSYTEIVLRMLQECGYPTFPAPLRFEYTLYHGNNRRVDVNNVCVIVDKFTCDALVKGGFMSDDKSSVVPVIVSKWGGVDKDNPRCELRIYPAT